MTALNPRHTRPHAPPPAGRTKLIGERLVERGALTQHALDDALRFQADTAPHKRIGEILIERGDITKPDLMRALADSIGYPFVDLDPTMATPDALRVLPREFIEEHNLMPLSASAGRLTIALENFIDVFLIGEISRRTGMSLEILAADPDNIRQVRAAVHTKHDTPQTPATAGRSLDDILEQIDDDELQVVDERADDDTNLEATATDSPTVKLVNYIIMTAIGLSASDIHIEPTEDRFRVRYRVDGELVPGEQPPRRFLNAVVSRIKILSGLDISERRLPQDGAVTVNLHDRAVDLRVSTMTTRNGEKIVIRLVDRREIVRGLGELGFEPAMLGTLRDLSHEPNGIVLVTGPTGSGKSTTLYAMLAEVLSDKTNISTIEDPIERRLHGLNQFQVRPKAGFGFAAALRALLRQDPDVIMVGEIRDAETARLATEAALTGHLVLSTLHTNDAPTAIPRLINMGAEPYMVAATVRAVLAQRLVRRVCTACAAQAPITPRQQTILASLDLHDPSIETGAVGAGCGRCQGAGTRGRVGVFDLMVTDETLLVQVIHDPTMRDLPRIANLAGSAGLLHDGLRKAKRGLIAIDDLLALARATPSASLEHPASDADTHPDTHADA